MRRWMQVPHGGATETPWPELVAATVNAGAPPASASSYEAPYAVWKHASMGQMRLVVRPSPHPCLGQAIPRPHASTYLTSP